VGIGEPCVELAELALRIRVVARRDRRRLAFVESLHGGLDVVDRDETGDSRAVGDQQSVVTRSGDRDPVAAYVVLPLLRQGQEDRDRARTACDWNLREHALGVLGAHRLAASGHEQADCRARRRLLRADPNVIRTRRRCSSQRGHEEGHG
jgi:hypothetical protein